MAKKPSSIDFILFTDSSSAKPRYNSSEPLTIFITWSDWLCEAMSWGEQHSKKVFKVVFLKSLR